MSNYEIQDTRLLFEEYGYVLLSESHSTSHQNLDVICPEGHQWCVSRTNFKFGRRCPKCQKTRAGDLLRYSIHLVRIALEAEGYVLISTSYQTVKTPLTCICPAGHTVQTTYNRFQQGKRCRKCSCSRTAEKQRLKYADVAQEFIDNGCELLATEYNGNKAPLEYRCCCGREAMIALISFRRGSRCQECERVKMSGANHWNYNPDREALALLRSVRSRAHAMLSSVLKQTNGQKNNKSSIMLGYTNQALMNHLTSDSNWQYLDRGNWHTDHIFPIKAFVDYGIIDVKIINALDNLRPVNALDNMRKNASYHADEFEHYLLNRTIQFVRPKSKS